MEYKVPKSTLQIQTLRASVHIGDALEMEDPRPLIPDSGSIVPGSQSVLEDRGPSSVSKINTPSTAIISVKSELSAPCVSVLPTMPVTPVIHLSLRDRILNSSTSKINRNITPHIPHIDSSGGIDSDSDSGDDNDNGFSVVL